MRGGQDSLSRLRGILKRIRTAPLEENEYRKGIFKTLHESLIDLQKTLEAFEQEKKNFFQCADTGEKDKLQKIAAHQKQLLSDISKQVSAIIPLFADHLTSDHFGRYHLLIESFIDLLKEKSEELGIMEQEATDNVSSSFIKEVRIKHDDVVHEIAPHHEKVTSTLKQALALAIPRLRKEEQKKIPLINIENLNYDTEIIMHTLNRYLAELKFFTMKHKDKRESAIIQEKIMNLLEHYKTHYNALINYYANKINLAHKLADIVNEGSDVKPHLDEMKKHLLHVTEHKNNAWGVAASILQHLEQ